MGIIRLALGIAGGVIAAGTALRLRSISRDRDVAAVELMHELPGLAASEARFLATAARQAVNDGLCAAREHEDRLEKVLSAGRRDKEMP